ncbi:hypothetical protein N8930_03900 [Euryarchaeota archaeon]|nr:hypothetical protein [Euryarchaeota archaeon]
MAEESDTGSEFQWDDSLSEVDYALPRWVDLQLEEGVADEKYDIFQSLGDLFGDSMEAPNQTMTIDSKDGPPKSVEVEEDHWFWTYVYVPFAILFIIIYLTVGEINRPVWMTTRSMLIHFGLLSLPMLLPWSKRS